MRNLFIIGNGFDLAHNLKTSYEDFHEYLKNEYPDAKMDGCHNIPESKMSHHGDIYYDDEEVAGVIMEIISEVELDGEKWSDLEKSLGYLDFNNYLDNYDDGEENEWHIAYNNEDRAVELAGALKKIPNYFSRWINTIKIDKSISQKQDFKKLIGTDSFYLNFNYTKTLENVYNVKNVCHIHGQQGEKLLFGHGNDKDYYEEYMLRHIGSEGALGELEYYLKKDTSKAIVKHKEFFDNISCSIDKIYSYGFSFSEVDEIYIKEICNKLLTDNVVWYLSDFENLKQRKEYIKTIKACGFHGKFDTYSIKK